MNISISKDLESDSRLQIGEIIGKGTERVCFAHKNNPNRCYKVSNKAHSKQTRREIKYFQYLKKKQKFPSFMPKFYAAYESGNYFIIEQDLLINNENFRYLTLRDFILQASNSDISLLEEKLEELKKEMLALNIITCDMRTTNIMVELKNNELSQIYIFDGYGAPEMLHLPNYLPLLGRWKILRQWKKFQRYYQQDLQKRSSQK